MPQKGIDVSHFNGLPTLDPYAFVFIKCTQGGTFVDPTYAARQHTIMASGKVFGAYHFCTMADSVESQLSNFNAHAAIREGHVIALDFEDDGTWAGRTLDAIATRGRALVAAFDTQYPNNRLVLYCNVSTYNQIVAPFKLLQGTDGLWIASPSGTPAMKYLFWQYSSNPIDQDQESTFDTLASLKEWTVMSTPSSSGVTLNADTIAAIAHAVAAYKNPDDATDVDIHQHAVDGTTALAAVRMVEVQMTELIAKVNGGQTVALTDGTTFTVTTPPAA